MKPFEGLRAIIYKEFIHVRRDPASLVFIFIIPLFQLTLFGYAIIIGFGVSFDMTTCRWRSVDQDRTPGVARQLVEALAARGEFEVMAAETDDAVGSRRAVPAKQVSAAVVIPPRHVRVVGSGASRCACCWLLDVARRDVGVGGAGHGGGRRCRRSRRGGWRR